MSKITVHLYKKEIVDIFLEKRITFGFDAQNDILPYRTHQ